MEEEVEKICSMAICLRTQHDRAVWMGNKNGDFSIHSAYHLAKDLCSRKESGCSTVDTLRPIWKKL